MAKKVITKTFTIKPGSNLDRKLRKTEEEAKAKLGIKPRTCGCDHGRRPRDISYRPHIKAA